MTHRFLCLLLALTINAHGRSRLESLFEYVRAESATELLEARYPLVHLVVIPTVNGFYFEPSQNPAALEYATYLAERAYAPAEKKHRTPFVQQVLAIKNLVPLLDRPPVFGGGTSTREYETGKVPAQAWAKYLRLRYPDLVVSVHRDGHGFCATGQEIQLNGTSELITEVEAPRPDN